MRILFLLACIVGFTACKNGKSHFVVKGKIDGAADSTVYLYKRGITGADLVDSAKIGKDFTFKIKSPSPSFPDLYVLALGKQMINLAVDSLETIEINASNKHFGTDYQVQGSQPTEWIRQMYLKQLQVSATFDQLKTQHDKKQITDSVYADKSREATEAFRKLSQDIILKDLRGLAAYYALFQQVNGYVLFDPLNKKDSRLFSAVATAWDTYHGQSPRAGHLKEYTLHAISQRRAMEGKAPSMMDKASVVDASKFFNISLPGLDEQEVDLNSLKGKVVLLDFTMYQADASPAHNIELNKVFQKFKNSGFTIYQVSFNTPIQFWKTSASNLPWVCVREDNTQSALLSRFNIQTLPTMFLINRQGEIVKRIEAKEDIASAVNKVL